jgi:hypothetical protein
LWLSADVQFRVTPEPLSYKVDNAHSGEVLLSLEHPKGIFSVWKLPPTAARNVGAALRKHADRPIRQILERLDTPSPSPKKLRHPKPYRP